MSCLLLADSPHQTDCLGKYGRGIGVSLFSLLQFFPTDGKTGLDSPMSSPPGQQIRALTQG